MFSLFSKDIGIDLGTANTLIFERGKGIVLREPSVVAVNRDTGEILAVGEEAKQMIGRTPGNIAAIRPLRDGVIADYNVTESMLRYFIEKVIGHSFVFRPRIMICVPSGVTTVEKRAVQEAAEQAGARRTQLIEEPMAAALGAGLPVDEATGSMVVDIGGGTTDVAVVSMNGIVTARTLKIAGNRFDQSIIRYVQNKYGILLGKKSAEEIKISLCNLYNPREDATGTVKGQNLRRGLPDQCDLSEAELFEALEEDITAIIEMIRRTLEETPPELVGDICQNGILLTGGGALMGGLEDYFSRALGVSCRKAKDPLTCVARGTAAAFSKKQILRDGFERIDGYQQERG